MMMGHRLGAHAPQCEKTFDYSVPARASASGYGIPALAGRAEAWSDRLKALPTTGSSHTPPPEGGTPYPDVQFHVGSGGSMRKISTNSKY